MIKEFNIEQIRSIYNDIYSQKIILSNLYNMNFHEAELIRTERSLIVRNNCGEYFRTYIVTSNLDDISVLLKSLDGINIINIPSKSSIDDWNNLLTNSGFELIGLYERYFNSFVTSKGNFVPNYATHIHLEDIYFLMNENFNKYTDHLPSRNELANMVFNSQILINEEDGILKGFFIYSLIGNKCYYNCWFDKSTNGLYLLFNIHALLSKKNLKYAYLWINSENTKVKNIYSYLGYKFDGLKDFTYKKNN